LAYELIIDNKGKKVEGHSDLYDKFIEIKTSFDNNYEFINFHLFEEVEEFLNKDEYKDYEIIECEECKLRENREELDEEYDDFYEEFPEDDEDNPTCCPF
jgi:CRISPR/Cas system CSM-associated protein Csm5 (group 7 of RAMP superfamily)